ncbi:MAG: prepilin peptidase [Proteobacteria bacterium]|nr:prepilin peptidase [Pseudomonadota bacterium]
MQAALANPVFVCGAALAFGLVVGSFLNVVIHRLPRDESVVRPRSHCPACRAPIHAWQNVPVLSYVVLGGRCAACRVPISLRYPAVELVTGLLFAAIVWRFGATPPALLWMGFGAALMAAALIDFDHQIIPDEISLGGLVAGLVLVPASAYLGGDRWLETALRSLTGAAVGGGTLWALGFAHARYCALSGRVFDHWPGDGEALPTPASLDYWTWFPGLGFGDVKLLAMIGAFVGPIGVLVTMVAASVFGLALGGVAAVVKRSADQPFGFAPALALGALVAVFAPSGWPLVPA